MPLTERQSLVGRAYAHFLGARFVAGDKEATIQEGLKLLMLASWPERRREAAYERAVFNENGQKPV